jgi:hypothetical protein
MTRSLVLALAVPLLAASGADAVQLCLARDGTLKARVTCRKKESLLDPATLGLVTPGPPGAPGAQGPEGPQGVPGPTGSPGANGATNAVVRSYNVGVIPPGGGVGDSCAHCEPGEVAVGGGITMDSFPGLTGEMRSSRPFPMSGTPTGWCASLTNIDSMSRTATVYVVCVSP